MGVYINHHVNIMFDTLVYQSTNQCWPKLQKFFVSKFNLQFFFWNEILVATKGSRQNVFDPPRHKNYKDGNWNSIIAIWQIFFKLKIKHLDTIRLGPDRSTLSTLFRKMFRKRKWKKIKTIKMWWPNVNCFLDNFFCLGLDFICHNGFRT